MLIENVRKLSPFDRLCYWIKERESIRLKKELDEPKPWTDDTILQSHRFCNVRRMDDKVSRWLMENWYEPYKDHPNMLEAVALARFINLPSSLGLLTPFIFHEDKIHWGTIRTVLRAAKKNGPIFNGAYMVRGNSTKSPDKVGTVIDEYIRPILNQVMIDNHSMERTWDQIRNCYGFGSFMAGQVVADLRWAVSGPWNDRYKWASVGPGSARGMGWVLYGDQREAAAKNFVCHPEQFTNVLVNQLITRLKENLPTDITRRLEAHDYQNCLCEQDKYSRTIFTDRRPKSRYAGTV